MKNRHGSDLMKYLALRAKDDIYFLGNVIAEFKAINGLSNLDISDYLQCPQDSLMRLYLCRLPDDQKERFVEDIKRIAGYANCNADKLVTLIRQMNSLRSLRGQSTKREESSLLMAARDRHPEKRPPRRSKKPAKKEPGARNV